MPRPHRSRFVIPGLLLVLALSTLLAFLNLRRPSPLPTQTSAQASVQPSAQLSGAAKVWRHKAGDSPCGVARSADRRRYTAWLRQMIFSPGGPKPYTHFDCRIVFTLDAPGPECFLVRLAPLPAADPDKRNALVGRGDLKGYDFNYYDKGAIVSASGPIERRADGAYALHAAGDAGYVANGVLLSVHTAASFALQPANKEQAAAALQKLGLTVQTQRWREMEAIYDELEKPRYSLALVREAPTLAEAPDRVTVFLRHDIDRSLYGALAMGREEQRRKLRASYYVNMASSLYGLVGPHGQYAVRDGAIDDLLQLQAMDHEIGYHTDILIMALFYDTPFKPWLDRELGRLRRAGVALSSQAEHGSFHTHEIKSHNAYAWSDFRRGGRLKHGGLEKIAPNGHDGVVRYKRDGQDRTYTIPEAHLQEYGFEVSAYEIVSSLAFTPKKWRYIPDQLLFQGKTPQDMLDLLRASELGDVVALLLHPSHWTVTDQSFDLGAGGP